MELTTPLKDAGRIFSMYAGRLARLEISTIGDLLFHIPSRYEDYSIVTKISEIQPGETVTIKGKITDIRNVYTRSRKTIQRAEIEDETGRLDITWFNQPFLVKTITIGDTVGISGKVGLFGKNISIIPSQYEILSTAEGIHTGRLVPIYPETAGVSSKWIRAKISGLLKEVTLAEYLPPETLTDHNLMKIDEAIRSIHFPKNLGDANKARRRLAFEELLLVQTASVHRRNEWQKNLTGPTLSTTKYKGEISRFLEKLPFTLTGAQKKAVEEIFKDLSSKKPMNRLLEGDVGSGKTVVAAISMYVTHLNALQSVFMAPTEILANQHYETISNLLSPLGVKIGLVTGSKRMKTPHNSKFPIHNSFDVLVGTHAVLSRDITFERLGLVVIDEQQRFGVEQRGIIRKKGQNPHLLTMTATPIPRTIALALYGDLDLSVLDEMPGGRMKIKTWLVPPEKRDAAHNWIKSQLSTFNSQVFIVCPFIEESESMQTVKAATKEYEYLKNGAFKAFSVGLLHGRMKAKEKNEVLSKFRDGKLDVLVATPVVEVGIDITNATIMVIEGAERFGLSQLHQLRGRVGRADKQSYCLLFTDSQNATTVERLRSLEKVHVGAELAELDLRLRGPGDMYGTRQHGVKNFKVASFSDFALIEETKKAAEKVAPVLSDYPLLQAKVKSLTIKEVAPD